MKLIKSTTPTILIVFGATGDLMQKKIIPSLYFLYKQKQLPTFFRVLGFSRGELSDQEFRSFIFKVLKDKKFVKDKKGAKEFLKLFHYQRGSFEKSTTYTSLAKHLGLIDNEWKACANKLFYLAVPPKFLGTIMQNLKKSHLSDPCGGDEGWARFILEKPFGSDGKTAASLEKLLSMFKPEQIYRIDHYLGKEMVEGIMNFRFSNNLFEYGWHNAKIERIDLILLETLGAEDRGSFYDSVGTFRDVGQNHLLAILALLTMEHPKTPNAEDIIAARAEILKHLPSMSLADIKKNTYRAQYDGYQKIKGVNPRSNTETYFKIKTELDHPRWRGVPIYIEAGKRMGQVRKEVIVTFKHPVPCMCPANRHFNDRVVFSISEPEGIRVDFWSKKPGFSMEVEKRDLEFLLYKKKEKRQYVEEYAKLLLFCMLGDQTWFVGKEEVKAAWRMVDPIVKAWQQDKTPLHSYKPDTSVAIHDADDQLEPLPQHNKKIGYIGLGKMGSNMSRRLMERGWQVVGYNKGESVTKKMGKEGLIESYSIKEMVEKLSGPRIVWLMVPSGKPVDEVLFGKDGLVKYLNKGDLVIDGGNSFYGNTIKRAKKLKKKGIRFLDCGVSGGPGGARTGACLMIGGEKKVFEDFEYLFSDIALAQGYEFFSGAGAGHFVKMVHNGIEYGMMQAIAEGFAVLKKSKFKLDLTRITDVYNHGSVIESHLIEWLYEAFNIYGEDLNAIDGKVAHSGEGMWTVNAAKKMKIKVKVIEDALKFRIESQKKPSYTGKINSALRGQFGQHPVLKNKNKKK